MSVFSQACDKARPFLGPATEKFMERQCKLLKVDQAEITKEHLVKLAWYVKSSASLIMDAAQAEKLEKTIAAG